MARLDCLRTLQGVPRRKLERLHENAVFSMTTPLKKPRVRVRVFYDARRAGRNEEQLANLLESCRVESGSPPPPPPPRLGTL